MGEYLGVIEPAPSTLSRYGLSLREWRSLCRRAGGVCEVHGGLPASKKLNIDHEHVPGWKRKTGVERKRFVRGLVCAVCNHYVLTRWADANRHRLAADYLDRYEGRKNASEKALE